MAKKSPSTVALDIIAGSIQVVRGHRVILDSDISRLYGVETKVLNQAVRRNVERFPSDFMFQLTAEEAGSLRSQTVTSKRGGRRYAPYAFTEQGVAMLSSVLNSPRAIAVNIQIMRVFVQLRRTLEVNRELARRLEQLEAKVDAGAVETAEHFRVVFEAIRQLMVTEQEDEKGRTKIGFDV